MVVPVSAVERGLAVVAATTKMNCIQIYLFHI